MQTESDMTKGHRNVRKRTKNITDGVSHIKVYRDEVK